VIATGGDSGGAEGDVPMPGCSDWTAVTGKKKPRKPRMTDEEAYVAYITGVDAVIAKINPLKLREGITQLVGKVDGIYIVGESLKVLYCLSTEQKSKLLRSIQLSDT